MLTQSVIRSEGLTSVGALQPRRASALYGSRPNSLTLNPHVPFSQEACWGTPQLPLRKPDKQLQPTVLFASPKSIDKLSTPQMQENQLRVLLTPLHHQSLTRACTWLCNDFSGTAAALGTSSAISSCLHLQWFVSMCELICPVSHVLQFPCGCICTTIKSSPDLICTLLFPPL